MDTVISIGQPAPDFQLDDLMGNSHTLKEIRGTIVVLNFWSAECSWCERVDRELMACLDLWKGKAQVWWIASNTSETKEEISRVKAERNIPMVLVDGRQVAANLYGAQTTPHFFVVDKSGRLAYQGAWDDVTFRKRQATRTYVPGVIEAIIAGETPKVTETSPYGCVLVRL
jgi:peroxiredoxin